MHQVRSDESFDMVFFLPLSIGDGLSNEIVILWCGLICTQGACQPVVSFSFFDPKWQIVCYVSYFLVPITQIFNVRQVSDTVPLQIGGIEFTSVHGHDAIVKCCSIDIRVPLAAKQPGHILLRHRTYNRLAEIIIFMFHVMYLCSLPDLLNYTGSWLISSTQSFLLSLMSLSPISGMQSSRKFMIVMNSLPFVSNMVSSSCHPHLI